PFSRRLDYRGAFIKTSGPAPYFLRIAALSLAALDLWSVRIGLRIVIEFFRRAVDHVLAVLVIVVAPGPARRVPWHRLPGSPGRRSPARDEPGDDQAGVDEPEERELREEDRDRAERHSERSPEAADQPGAHRPEGDVDD